MKEQQPAGDCGKPIPSQVAPRQMREFMVQHHAQLGFVECTFYIFRNYDRRSPHADEDRAVDTRRPPQIGHSPQIQSRRFLYAQMRESRVAVKLCGIHKDPCGAPLLPATNSAIAHAN